MSSEKIENLKDTKKFCFGCGVNNPIGLKLKFHFDGQVCKTEFIPKEYHQGFDGVVHGGITATILDEAVANLFYQQNRVAMTAELTIKYHYPLRVGKKYYIEAEIEKQRGILTYSTAYVYDENGKKMVTAKAKQIESDGKDD